MQQYVMCKFSLKLKIVSLAIVGRFEVAKWAGSIP